MAYTWNEESTLEGSSLAKKYKARLKIVIRDKHSSLFVRRVSDAENVLIDINTFGLDYETIYGGKLQFQYCM